MSTTDVTKSLMAEDVIPDILPTGTVVRRNLKVVFQKAKLERPGQMIDRDDTQPKPTVFVDPPPEEDVVSGRPAYTLMMVDPDLTHRHDTRFGQVRHWLVTDCSINSAGEVIESRGKEISPWVGPAPIPAHYVMGKPHPSRYTFILCRNKSSGTSSLSQNLKPQFLDMESKYEGLPNELGKPTQDLFDRWKFNTAQFIMNNNLEVVAATFMLVEGNIKSGVKNAGLMAGAVVDKIGEAIHT